MPKIESEKIDCLHWPCSRPAPRGKIKSVRTHSEVIEQFDSFSLLKLLFLVKNWHCSSRKAFTRQMTPQIREETAKTAVFRQRWQAWKVVRSIAAVRRRPRTPRNWRCSFAFFESFLWHFNKKQHAEVIFRLSRPVLCKNQENGSGKQWSLHAPLNPEGSGQKTGVRNGACAHYVMVSKYQWKPFWLATQRDPQNDWTTTQNGVNYDVFAQAPLMAIEYGDGTAYVWQLKNSKSEGCCVYAWKRNELSRGAANGAKRKWQGKWRQKNTKRSRREHGSVKNSLTLPSRHASAKKEYIRWAKGGFWRFGSDLTRCRLWQAEGFEAMEEGVRAIAKTSNFQSEHVRLKTIFFAGRD